MSFPQADSSALRAGNRAMSTVSLVPVRGQRHPRRGHHEEAHITKTRTNSPGLARGYLAVAAAAAFAGGGTRRPAATQGSQAADALASNGQLTVDGRQRQRHDRASAAGRADPI